MGSASRMRPKHLGEKLLAIRSYFECSLAQMSERLSTDNFTVRRTAISAYELGDREPPLPVLLKYARLAGITIDILADDDINLSDYFPKQGK